MSDLRLYLRYLGVSLRAQMQYPFSLAMLALGHGILTGIEFLGLWALFARFGSILSWSLHEVALFYGMVNASLALGDITLRGFDTFSSLVRGGDFDRLLLRPRSTVVQVAGRELPLRRTGRLLQGVIVIIWALSALDIALDPARLGLLLFALLGGGALFSGLLILQATACFWTIEGLEVFNIVTHGGVEAGQYPLDIYRDWFRRFFTFVVPLAMVGYYPAHALLGRVAPGVPDWFPWIAPIFGIIFLLVALRVWRFGVRHYLSTGS